MVRFVYSKSQAKSNCSRSYINTATRDFRCSPGFDPRAHALPKASNVASFAVDIKIYNSIESLSGAVPLQADLRSLESRAEASGLVLSEDKCSYQRISGKKTPLLHCILLLCKKQSPTIYHPRKGPWRLGD